METRAERINWSIDQDGTWLHLLVADGQEARAYAEGTDKPQRVKITRWRDKRSLSANAYAWTLLGKLSAALHLPAEEIYRQLIPDVGGNFTTVSVDLAGLSKLRETWSSNGKGWLVDVIGAGAKTGTLDVALYYGSSVYDTAQMARLIDLIIAECRENEIEYLPPDQLAAMLEGWHGER